MGDDGKKDVIFDFCFTIYKSIELLEEEKDSLRLSSTL